MNTLSIFLYLANVIPNIGVLFFTIGLISFIILIIFTLFIAIDNDSYGRKPNNSNYTSPLYYIKWFWVPIVAATISSVIPSERTMYMIAASELGEVAVMNEEVQEVFDALKERILIELRPTESTN